MGLQQNIQVKFVMRGVERNMVNPLAYHVLPRAENTLRTWLCRSMLVSFGEEQRVV
ncbi:MAG: hypothetical protein OXC02_05425 [Rhodobacteraceae bacterium]|nr:hypothetical protein [Paracoccaceae bacterium]